MRQKILGAWQTWRAKAEEPDCGRDAPPAQAAHLKRGHAAETLAATYLQGHGLGILARNVRFRGGDRVGHELQGCQLGLGAVGELLGDAGDKVHWRLRKKCLGF